MSSPNNADVIQGRLGWEDGDISEADPEELEPHPKNEEIYGDTESAADLDKTFISSVREKGVLEPLVITNGKQIISGHRRWLAAKATDTDRVPVRKSEFDSDLAEREALIEFNRQREKTPGQIVNEFEEMEEIEKRRLDEKGQTTQGRPPKALKDLDTGGNVSTSSEESINENQGERSDLNDTCRSNEREVKDSYEDAAESFARSLKDLTIRKRFLMVSNLIVQGMHVRKLPRRSTPRSTTCRGRCWRPCATTATGPPRPPRWSHE